MTNVALRTLGVAATAAVLAVFAIGASAQEKKAPAKRPPACSSLKAEADCSARADCNWVAESAKGKVKHKAYCRANPAPAKKK
jgi:hypothetical protein